MNFKPLVINKVINPHSLPSAAPWSLRMYFVSVFTSDPVVSGGDAWVHRRVRSECSVRSSGLWLWSCECDDGHGAGGVGSRTSISSNVCSDSCPTAAAAAEQSILKAGISQVGGFSIIASSLWATCTPSFLCPLPVYSEHMNSLSTLPSAVSDPGFPSPSLGLPSATPSPSVGLPSGLTQPSSTATPTVSRVDSNSQRSLPPHLGFSQSKDVPSPAAGPLTVRIGLINHRKDLYMVVTLMFYMFFFFFF